LFSNVYNFISVLYIKGLHQPNVSVVTSDHSAQSGAGAGQP